MATDYSILENELSDMKKNLKRELHMHKIKRLSKKQDDLARSVIQRKQIEILLKNVAELESTVSTVYSSHHAVKDEEIRSYLVYLLKMKDFFTREVIMKQDLINQKEFQIMAMVRKLCTLFNKQSKKVKQSLVKSSEFIRMENISNRINQINKRISTIKQENKERRENIKSMAKFQNQFKAFEEDFSSKILFLKSKAEEHLDSAVAAYDDKDTFMNRESMFQERRAQDMRKTAINENALHLYLDRIEKNETFRNLQDNLRTDKRLAEAGDMISKGITGLESNLEKMYDLQSAISIASGEEAPENMEDGFKLKDDKMNSLFSYLDELLRDIHNLRNEIDDNNKEIEVLIEDMSSNDRKWRRDIKNNQDEAKSRLEEAEDENKSTNEAKSFMSEVLDIVKNLYIKVCPDDRKLLLEQPLDDSTVMDYLQNMEKQLLDYLICAEYIDMKAASKDETPLSLESEENGDEVDELSKLEDTDLIQPRTLESDSDLSSLAELVSKRSFLEFEDLKEKAVATASEVDSEKNRHETFGTID